MRPWRLLRDRAPGPGGGAARNMAVDEALLCHVDAPVLRLYGWRAPCATLGYRQAEPDWLPRAKALGIEAVRRITGGGAVLHAGDLTYAVVAPCDAAELPAGLDGSYAWIREVLIEGLRRVGLDARPARPPAGGAAALELCFAGSTGYEVELDGRKLVGSAQRRTRQGVLQHGSIRLRDDGELHRALFGAAPPAAAAGIDRERAEAGIVSAFETALSGALEPAELSPAEARTAAERERWRQRAPLSAPPLSSSGSGD